MSEQFPLLCDDLSEEERFSPHFHRHQPMSRGRAKDYVKGAAAIITRWPDHWTTLLTYWWIGFGMIALSTFIIYNSVFSYAMLQPANKISTKSPNINMFKPITKSALPPTVFMHIFVNDKQEIDLNKYLPYIEIVTNKYENFNYEVIIVANDTIAENKNYSEEENNKIALNTLWVDDSSYKNLLSSNSNLKIKHTTLSYYLNDSPIKTFWKNIPYQFIKFLVRAVSVWEKGGIAFDPIILTPQSPHSVYIDKIQNILQKYKGNEKNIKISNNNNKEQTSSRKRTKMKHKLNNIRDIINALENEDTSENTRMETLAEAETNDNLLVTSGRKLLSVAKDSLFTKNETNLKLVHGDESNDMKNSHENTLQKDSSQEKLDGTSKINLLPLFLDYLFHNKQTNHTDETTTEPKQLFSPLHKDISKIKESSTKQMRDFLSDIKKQDIYKPMIVSAKGIFNYNDSNIAIKSDTVKYEDKKLFEVTIDLQGNILATDIACHAFVGSLFSNVIHHDQNESVTDLIIKELSIFCKGVLASCVGIDVILL